VLGSAVREAVAAAEKRVVADEGMVAEEGMLSLSGSEGEEGMWESGSETDEESEGMLDDDDLACTD
jgi:hypothetical protein